VVIQIGILAELAFTIRIPKGFFLSQVAGVVPPGLLSGPGCPHRGRTTASNEWSEQEPHGFRRALRPQKKNTGGKSDMKDRSGTASIQTRSTVRVSQFFVWR